MLINGEKYFHICTAGDYPQGNITIDLLREVVASYDPAFHDAPCWIGHTDFNMINLGKDEPQALAWIKRLHLDRATGKLYAAFGTVSWQLEYILSEEYYRYVSCEFARFVIGNKEVPYLFAVGLTNRPAVSGMDPLKVKQSDQTDQTNHVLNDNYVSRICLSYENKNFLNHNNPNMNEHLMKTAEKVGLDLKKFTTESSLAEAINVKLSELQAKHGSLEDDKQDPNTGSSDSKYSELEAKVKKLEEEKTESAAMALADLSVSQKKVLPAQRNGIYNFAKSNFEAAKKYVNDLPVLSIYDSEKINSSAKLEGDKFKNDKGERVTFSSLLNNPGLILNYNDEELKALEEEEKSKVHVRA